MLFIAIHFVGERESAVICGVQVFTVIRKKHQEEEVNIKMADQKSCDLCPKTFANVGSLNRHRQTHSGGKRYKCACTVQQFI